MGNKGYRAESNFETIIQNSLSVEKAMGYSEVWRLCSKAGVGSKQTLSKYLKRLEKTGFIIHDSDGYRKSALTDNPKLSELRKTLPEPSGKSWQYSYFTTPSPAQKISETQLLRIIQQEFNLTFHTYAWMLTKLVQTNNRAAAQELVGIFMRSQITPTLDELAKNIWLARKTIPPLNVLKRKKLVITDT